MGEALNPAEGVEPTSGAQPDSSQLRVPDAGSEALASFWRWHFELFNLFGFIGAVVLGADEVRKVAAQALAETSHEDKERERWESVLQDGKTTQKRLLIHRQAILEMMLSRATDNFLTYLSDVLATVFRTKPETLKSGRQVRIDFVLEHEGMTELVSALAERTVEDLSYRGVAELADYVETMGLPLFAERDDMQRAIRIVETRNLIVHNRTVVNGRFASRVGVDAVGQLLSLETAPVFDDMEFLAGSAIAIDERAVAKFNLPVAEIRQKEAGSEGDEEAPSR
jgi:hypothetical protein